MKLKNSPQNITCSVLSVFSDKIKGDSNDNPEERM